MPCHFSGLFYVSQFKDNKLLCSFKDENGDIHQINMIYYFPTTVDRPFPQAYEAIQSGHVYFITGTMSFQNKDLLVHFLILLIILIFLKMNVISVYRQDIYTDLELSNTIVESVPQALSSMFLTIIDTAKVTQAITALSALKDNFLTWKYFVRQFEQYIAGNKHV